VLVLDMIEILPPLGKYKYDTWRILLVKCYIDNSVHMWSCIQNINTILLGGDDGVILPSLQPNVSSSLEDNDASTFVGPSLHLHTSLRCLEAKMWTWRCHKSVDSSYARCSRSLVVLIPLPTRSHVQLQCTNMLAKGRSQLF
jgi:hypothetical protein